MTTGYLSQSVITQLKLMADKAELDKTRIGGLIRDFLSSQTVRDMDKGEAYYNTQHDILSAERYYYVDGVKQVSLKSNETLPHPFHKILVDQKINYILGKPPVVSVDGAGVKRTPDLAKDQFQTYVTDLLGTIFNDRIRDWAKGASNKSVDWLHPYVDAGGDLRYVICPAQSIIPVFDTQYENELIYVIRFYHYNLIDSKGNTVTRKKVEWWSKKDVTYWVEDEAGFYFLDASYVVNPAPHYSWEYVTNTAAVREDVSWGRVPFIPLYNNSDGKSDLDPIKYLIDSYDKVKSGWINDINDFAEMLLVIKGFTGLSGEAQTGLTQLGLFIKNMQEDHAIFVEGGTEGSVENIRADIPVEAKERFLKITWKEIFFFGRGVDVSDENIGNSPSGIALQFLYAALDQKCDELILKLKTGLESFFWFVTEYINQRYNKSYDSKDIKATVNKSMIFNKKELIDGNIARKGFLSNRTLLALDPDVDNVEEELQRLEEENAANETKKAAEFERQLKLAQTQGKSPVT